MKTLRINCCEDCPHSSISNEYGIDDSYIVTCNHEDQTTEDPSYTHKMKNSNRVYFQCPLDKEVFNCENCGIDTDWIHPVDGMCEKCCLENDNYEED